MYDSSRPTDDESTTRRAFLRRTAAAGGAGAALALGAGPVTAQSGPDYGGWFDGTSNFDGTYDFTGKASVTVKVGASGNGGNFAFSPAAVRVDSGTTVTWEWTGEGGGHNVVADDGSFESKLQSQSGATFEHTFEKKGVHKYFCQPHKSLGMKGAVVVGGSGGLDPSKLESSGGGSGGSGGSGGESGGGNGGGGERGSGGESGGGSSSFPFAGATLATGLVAGLLSPIFFGAVLLFRGTGDDGEGPPETRE